MKDTEILGTGNSRYMKSAISETATWEEFRAMLRAGTFAFDFNGINEAGFAQVGDALSKNTFLKDSTADLLGGDASMVPDEALVALKSLIDWANSNANTKAIVQSGTYTGTGAGGSANPKTLTFNFVPKFLLIFGGQNENGGIHSTILAITASSVFNLYYVNGYMDVYSGTHSGNSFVKVTSFGQTITFYAPSVDRAFNESGVLYSYIAIG